MEYIAKPFGFIMKFCYNLLSNYGVAIILFTLITKIILFPIACRVLESAGWLDEHALPDDT